MAPSIDDFLDQVEPRVVTVRVPIKGDLLERIGEISRELGKALREDESLNLPDRAPQLQAELDQLRAEMEDNAVTFRFVGLSNRAWSELLAECPPDDKERAQGLDFHPETFIPAAISASCTDPDGITPDKVLAMMEKLTLGVFDKIWSACLLANIGVEDDAVPTSAAAIGGLLDSVVSSTTAAPEASPTASSTAE